MSDDPICAKCGHPRSNHPYRHPFVGPSRDEIIKAQADRIEELEIEVETWKSRALHQNEVVGKLEAERDEAWRRAAYTEEQWGRCEVKLAKAVEWFDEIRQHCANSGRGVPSIDERIIERCEDTAAIALAELKGEK